MTLFEFVILGFAVYYLATAFVNAAMSFNQWYHKTDYMQRMHGARYKDVRFGWLLKWSESKPFNCELCMSFYIAVVLVPISLFLPIWVIFIPAIAGLAVLLHAIKQKLEIFVS